MNAARRLSAEGGSRLTDSFLLKILHFRAIVGRETQAKHLDLAVHIQQSCEICTLFIQTILRVSFSYILFYIVVFFYTFYLRFFFKSDIGKAWKG